MLPFDVTELVRSRLARDRRPPDGKLHPSGDLIGSLRHAQLRAAGAPTIESETVSDVRLMTGTLWHSWFEDAFRAARLPVMTELKLDAWLPEGWSGTADWLIWNGRRFPDGAFVLGDLKTIKGEGMKFVEREGVKQEHLWQASAYWHAAADMGIPLVHGFVVYYLPQNAPVDEPGVVPSLQEGTPLDRDVVVGRMEERWQATKIYLEAVDAVRAPDPQVRYTEHGVPETFVNEHLAPEQDRIQIVRWNKQRSVWDVKLAPHWSATYCPYPSELCTCRSQGTEKIGEYVLNPDGVEFTHRKDYEVAPTVEPSAADITKKRKELAGE
jgi:hypothetical protein